MNQDASTFFDELERQMPLVFSRQEASRLIGNIISPNSLRNLDSKHQGPQNKTVIGKKVCYEKKSFISWLKNYKYYSNKFQKNSYRSTFQY
ncbi:MAG: hypothetical protein LBP22_12045 [Deltaproteobacteria bacterium]|jgi:hypothetical protein|nr:hypothetical protein [Deltaproteobacteria bacterium]